MSSSFLRESLRFEGENILGGYEMRSAVKNAIVRVGFIASLFTVGGMFFLPQQAEGAPQLLYASAKAGSNVGWEQSATQGNAISIWGYDLGTIRGSSTVTVAGVTLAADSSYAEWGATTNPKTAKGMQRITFWLNSSMANGDTSGIYVSVNGVRSNTLPFTINNACKSLFVDYINGNDSWNGLYKDNSRGGNNGPWKTPYLKGGRNARPALTAGAFIYMRGQTYRVLSDYTNPYTAVIGYLDGNPCDTYLASMPLVNGTDALRITLTEYPGERAVFWGSDVANFSSYWTFTNFEFNGDDPNRQFGNAYTMGYEWAMCTYCGDQYRSKGLEVIGMAFTGYQHHSIHSFGDNFRIVGNYFNIYPTASESGSPAASTSYTLYLSSGDNLVVANNELHGGADYVIHNYDETRCSGGADLNRHMHNHTFDSNLIDINRSAIAPQNMRAGIIVGNGIGENLSLSNHMIKNNIFYCTDSLLTGGAITYADMGSGTRDGIYVYNNTIYSVPSGIYFGYNTRMIWTNVEFKNNIFSNIGSYDYASGGVPNLTPTISYNLFGQTPRFSGSVVQSNNLVGNPQYVNASTLNFHLQATSPAVGGGVNLAPALTRDYDFNPRPGSAGWSIGAFEYGGATPPPGVKVPSAPSILGIQ